jgi:small subunit ribosomal protein S21
LNEKNEKNEEVELGPIEVRVDRDNVARAISQLKRMMAREGILKEVKNRRFYEKPSEKDKRKRLDAERRRRKEARKERAERRGHR